MAQLQLKSKIGMWTIPKYDPKLEQDLKDKINAILKEWETTQKTPTYTQRERFDFTNKTVKEITDSLAVCYQALQKELEERVLHPKVIEKYPNACLNLFKQLTMSVQKAIAIENAQPIVNRALSNYWNSNKPNVEEHSSSEVREESSSRSEYRRFF